MHLSCLLHVLHAQLISLFVIWSLEKYLVRRTDLKTRRYVVFFILLVPLHRPINKYPSPSFVFQCENKFLHLADCNCNFLHFSVRPDPACVVIPRRLGVCFLLCKYFSCSDVIIGRLSTWLTFTHDVFND
jgi:hypothetical protein